MKNNQHLVWIDLEKTGLEPAHDHILEIATVVTDSALNIIATGPVLALHQPQTRLDGMDDWNQKQHASSGLIQRVLASALTDADAEQATLDFIGVYLDPGHSPMCGNSICQDRRFLWHYMPQLEIYFHYRNLDVSTLKELAKRWKPHIMAGLKKKNTHAALDDIRESVEELKILRKHFFRKTRVKS